MSEREPMTAWIYRGLWSSLVRWFDVPDEPPTLPADAAAPATAFKPAAGFLRYLRMWFWIIAIIFDVVWLGTFAAVSVALFIEGLWWVALLMAPFVLLVAVVPDVVAYVALHLRYDTTHYVINDRSIRIRRGVWVIHETTITFENVQNLRITQGPVQRSFGIANLVVETAGAGGESKGRGGPSATANQGVVEGIANAAALRDRILARVKRSSRAGLGDDEEERDARGGLSPTHVAVLREIRDALVAATA